MGARHQVRTDVEPHARRDDQSGLRPGRSRSRAAQPHRVRDVLRRAAPVLPRGHWHLPVRRRTRSSSSTRVASGATPQLAGLVTDGRRTSPAHRASSARASSPAAWRAARRSACSPRVTERDQRRRHDDRAAHDVRAGARDARLARGREHDRHDGHRGRPRARTRRVDAYLRRDAYAAGMDGRHRFAKGGTSSRGSFADERRARRCGARSRARSDRRARVTSVPTTGSPSTRRARRSRGHRHSRVANKVAGLVRGAASLSTHVRRATRPTTSDFSRAPISRSLYTNRAAHAVKPVRVLAKRVARVLRRAALHDGGTAARVRCRGVR